ncbi:tetratricopeptide repeat protein [Streptomyces scopuliridis]|uniref:tetratricopeptide repeat protein n=1 Tax=Streptomyces scopuliridis TaxID=452529 RepID=UPI003447AC2E
MTETPGVAASGARAAAAGTNYGIISTGDGATIDSRTVHLPAEAFTAPAEVVAAGGLTNLPAPRSPVFVGRRADLAGLSAAMSDGPPMTPSVVHGLGGMGKSTLALHFAHHHRSHYNPIWWIPAETPSSITQALADLAARLNPYAHLTTANSAESAAWALSWLQTHEGWLLVFDNAESPGDLESVIGPLTSGRHLITSRRSTGWHRLAKPRALHTLPSEAAVDMLTRIIEADDIEEDEEGDEGNAGIGDSERSGTSSASPASSASVLERIAAELGHLPLAMEQAAAYIQYTALAPDAYLERLRRYPARMFAAAAPTGAAGESDNHRTVARIWQLSLRAITAEAPLAGEILRTFAWFSSEPVPRDLAHALHVDPLMVDEALALLHTYSMITLTRRTFTIHRLVRAVTRTPDPADPHRAAEAINRAQQQAEQVLRRSLPEDPLSNVGGWARWRHLLPHIHALTDLISPEQDTEDTAAICLQVSLFLQREGHSDQAVGYAQRAVTAFAGLRGTDDPVTFAARSFLASALRAAGDLARAVPLHLRNLADCERVLGPDHPDTLVARGNLAYLHALKGDLREALELHRRNLADYERTLGPDHPHTLNARANLASSFRSAGDLAQAVELHDQALTDHERVLGPTHPETLTARSNLAYALQLAGESDRAMALHERVLADRERVFGPGHPHTELARQLLTGAQEARRARSGPGAD